MTQTELVSTVIRSAIGEMTRARLHELASQTGATEEVALPEALQGAVAAMAETLSQELARYLGLAATPEIEVLRERVLSLTSNSVGERPSEVFDELCQQSHLVFGDADPTDAEILANAATPALMRYLVSALRSYHYRDRSKIVPAKKEAMERAKTLAKAMLATNPPGKPSTLQAQRCELADVADDSRSIALQRKLTRREAELAAAEAAYALHRQDERDMQNGPDRDRTMKRVRKLLRTAGVLRER